METSITLRDDRPEPYPYNVRFLNEKNEELVRSFTNPEAARRFWNRLRYSKTCVPISISKASY